MRLPFFFLAVFLVSGCASEKSNAEEKKGNKIPLSLTVYLSYPTGEDSKEIVVEERSFDANGKTILLEDFNEEGKLEYKETYTYNEKGQEIESVSRNSKGTISLIVQREYNAVDSNYRLRILNSDYSLRLTYQCYYDSRNLDSLTILRNADGSLHIYDRYIYNDRGQMVLWDRYDSLDKLIHSMLYTYDENGSEIKNTGSGLLGGTYYVKYNAAKRKTEELAINNEDSTVAWFELYQYDEANRLTMRIKYHDKSHYEEEPMKPYQVFRYAYKF